jgi:polysaccharide deacetylase family protein (PEP-CTERM system associated)
MTANQRRPSDVVNALTIDVEDYFHVSVFDGIVPRTEWSRLQSRVCSNTERLLEIIGDTKGTFFVLGWVAERFPSLVRTIARAGHEIASHGFGHRLVYDQTPPAFREDIRRAKAVLEDAAGVHVAGYRAPSYSVTPQSLWALDILIEEGYQYDASIFPIHHDRYGIPLSPRHSYAITRRAGVLLEAPASTTTFGPLNLPVTGGGYFRILPYMWTQRGIGRLNHRERRPAIFYLHPWEIDAEQPRLATGMLGHFRHYHNLHKTEHRLRRLLREFQFTTMADVLKSVSFLRPTPDLPLTLPYLW